MESLTFFLYLCTLIVKRMIIIADSGSTKTDWTLINKSGEEKLVQTAGLNPFFVDQATVTEVLQKDLHPFLDQKQVQKVFFFGSGCFQPMRGQVIQSALDDFFRQADIDVYSDLLGAAYALCGHTPGMVGILGTGAGTCTFDGEKITDTIPSLGYLLGDEGSGAFLGRILVNDFFTNDLPENLQKDFSETYDLSLHKAMDAVYKQAFPNRFLASFVPFLKKHKNNDYVQNILQKSFDLFFDKQILKYQETSLPLSMTGSVAFHFEEEIRKSAQRKNIAVHAIEETPMRGLIAFYQDEIQKMKQ